jgi:antitoxin CptB
MTPGAGEPNMNPGELGRIRWQCRRGMRELDVLLERYLRRDYPLAGKAERDAFRSLLERQDSELNALLFGPLEAEGEALANVLERIRRPA